MRGLSLFLLLLVGAFGADWHPLDPAHLALKTPRIDKDADAEAIFWEVRVEDEAQGGDPKTTLRHYLRVKIFTERGRESRGTVDITFAGKTNIIDIAGRTIKPDGSIVELKKDAVFERTVVKLGGMKVKTKSFAMPGVEPGAIIEYRWREVRNDALANYIRLYFQQEIPVWFVKYYIKPFSNPYFPFAMRTRTFHCQPTPFAQEPQGFYSTALQNVPAFREEPRMPAQDQVKAWMLIYYSEDKKLSPDKYWKEYGKELFQNNKPGMKVNDQVKKLAVSLTQDASTHEDKLKRLVDYCRTNIKNIWSDSSGVSAEAREAYFKKRSETPADTIKNGMGSGHDINLLFAALATASGYDARLAKLSDGSDLAFDKEMADSYFLNAYDVAVKVDGQWKLYDPGTPYLQPGVLRWQEEGQQALISDPKDPVFVQTPISTPEFSLIRRKAALRLDEAGTLEGDLTVEHTGHSGVAQKNSFDADSPEKRVETLIERAKDRLSTAEVSEVAIENVTDHDKPFSYRYKIKVPGYAQRTGRRLFVQPAYFQRNVGPMFATSQRTYPIFYNYPWTEHDSVTIELPEGYSLDHAESPAGSKIANVGTYDVNLSVTKDGKKLVYERKFRWGNEGRLYFPASAYAELKRVFDYIHQQDGHAITLKQDQ